MDEQDRNDIEAVSNLITSEVNVKEVQLLDDAAGILVKKIKPNFKVLGPKYGANVRLVNQAIQALGDEEINRMEKEGQIEMEVNGNKEILLFDEVEIST